MHIASLNYLELINLHHYYDHIIGLCAHGFSNTIYQRLDKTYNLKLRNSLFHNIISNLVSFQLLEKTMNETNHSLNVVL